MKATRRFGNQLDRLRWRVTRPVRVAVRLLLWREGQVILARSSRRQVWHLPTVRVHAGETLSEAARARTAGELGLDVGALKLHGVFSRFYDYRSEHVVVLYSDELAFTRDLAASVETLQFFDPGALPERISRGAQRRILEALEPEKGPYLGRW